MKKTMKYECDDCGLVSKDCEKVGKEYLCNECINWRQQEEEVHRYELKESLEANCVPDWIFEEKINRR